MGRLGPREYELKTGEKLLVRTAVPEDAEALLEHARIILTEDLYNVTTVDELKETVERERKWIAKHIERPGHILLVAELGGSVAGLIHFESGSRKRLAHQGVVRTGVNPRFRRKGIGTALLQSVISWGEQDPLIEKLTLEVFATNKPAIALYKSLGFVEEGRRLRHVKISDGEYVDVIVMYRFVKV